MRTLSEYHNETTLRLCAVSDSDFYIESQGNKYDKAADLAIEILSNAGLVPDDEDDAGEPVESDVQTLLTLAMFRSPELYAYLEGLSE